MQIELSDAQKAFVKQAVSDGRYASESEAINQGIRLLQAHDEKLAELRATIQESLKDTREVSDEEMDEALEGKAQELLAQGIPL